MINQCKKEIDRYKKQLQRAKFEENFGQKAVRKLRDKFDDMTYTMENKAIKDLINDFDNWCMNYSHF